MHSRQHEAGQLPLVFNAIERYEKDIALCTCCQLIATITDVLKLMMSIDAPGTTCGTVEWSIPLEKAYQPTS